MELENPNFLPEEILMEIFSRLPEEILIEIFSRLPLKAVGKCRCLSKTWRTRLSTSHFAKSHLLNRTTNPENLFLFKPSYSPFHIIDGLIPGNTVSSRKLDFGITWNEVLGSCNGLVLLSNRNEELLLVNPNTKKHFKLPPLSSSFGGFIFSRYGLGYDGFSDDYKVVGFTYCSVVGHLGYSRIINAYSVKSGAWKRVGDPQDCSAVTTTHGWSFVNEAIHWYSIRRNTDDSDSVYVICAFDFAGDVFHEIPAAPLVPDRLHDITLLVLEGCLCMSSAYNLGGNFELWMMKQYGLPDSWTKFSIATNSELRAYRLICSIGDSEIVFVSYCGALVVYNLREGTTKVMVVDRVSVTCLEGVAFVDSLVSPRPQPPIF